MTALKYPQKPNKTLGQHKPTHQPNELQTALTIKTQTTASIQQRLTGYKQIQLQPNLHTHSRTPMYITHS